MLMIVLGAQAQSLDQAPPPLEFPAPVPVETEDENLREETIRFPSAFQSGIPENDQVYVRLLRPNTTEPRPWVIILHYWGASDQRLERALAADLNRQGIGAALMTLPYHLQRTPPGVRSGALAVRPDPAALRATMIQAVWDVRRTADYLQTRRDVSRLGIAGISLGSLVSALAYAVEPRLEAAGFMLGGADLAHILWNSSRVVAERDRMRMKGYTEAKLREELASVEPLNYLSRRQNPRAFVVGGKFDSVIPTVDTQKLIDALPGAKSLFLDTGHYGGIFVQRRVVGLISEFMAAEFAGRSFEPPRRIYAPTLRIGAEVSLESPLQVGIGVDLFATARRDWFISFLATPRGPKLFGGFQLDKNLSLGVFGTTRRISPGLFWSTIL